MHTLVVAMMVTAAMCTMVRAISAVPSNWTRHLVSTNASLLAFSSMHVPTQVYRWLPGKYYSAYFTAMTYKTQDLCAQANVKCTCNGTADAKTRNFCYYCVNNSTRSESEWVQFRSQFCPQYAAFEQQECGQGNYLFLDDENEVKQVNSVCYCTEMGRFGYRCDLNTQIFFPFRVVGAPLLVFVPSVMIHMLIVFAMIAPEVYSFYCKLKVHWLQNSAQEQNKTERAKQLLLYARLLLGASNHRIVMILCLYWNTLFIALSSFIEVLSYLGSVYITSEMVVKDSFLILALFNTLFSLSMMHMHWIQHANPLVVILPGVFRYSIMLSHMFRIVSIGLFGVLSILGYVCLILRIVHPLSMSILFFIVLGLYLFGICTPLFITGVRLVCKKHGAQKKVCAIISINMSLQYGGKILGSTLYLFFCSPFLVCFFVLYLGNYDVLGIFWSMFAFLFVHGLLIIAQVMIAIHVGIYIRTLETTQAMHQLIELQEKSKPKT